MWCLFQEKKRKSGEACLYSCTDWPWKKRFCWKCCYEGINSSTFYNGSSVYKCTCKWMYAKCYSFMFTIIYVYSYMYVCFKKACNKISQLNEYVAVFNEAKTLPFLILSNSVSVWSWASVLSCLWDPPAPNAAVNAVGLSTTGERRWTG